MTSRHFGSNSQLASIEYLPCKRSLPSTYGKGSRPEHLVTIRILRLFLRIGRTTMTSRPGSGAPGAATTAWQCGGLAMIKLARAECKHGWHWSVKSEQDPGIYAMRKLQQTSNCVTTAERQAQQIGASECGSAAACKWHGQADEQPTILL